MAHGGRRPNQGRPKGSKNKATLEKAAVVEAFNQRVLNHADELFNAQFKLATGSQMVFRVDKVQGPRGAEKKEHTLVTDPDEIKALLDDTEGEGGFSNGKYYYFQAVLPDIRASESLLNRTMGKPKESIEHTNKLSADDQKFFDKLITDAMVQADASGELKSAAHRDAYRQQIIDGIVAKRPEAAPYLGKIG